MNPGDDSHPNHHDVAVLLTRINICMSEKACGLLGLAKLAGACAEDLAAAVCEDDGLKLGFLIAHELGHTLGMLHDTAADTGCPGTYPDGFNTIMAPNISMKTRDWSNCSREYLGIYLEAGYGRCLEDEPSDHDFHVDELLAGVMYGGDYQCRQVTAIPQATMCDTGADCLSLNCYVEKYGCLETHIPMADGSQCGEKKWCYHGQCVSVGQRPAAVDGGWGAWGSWSECSRSCGSGVEYSQRLCDNPPPQNGGRYCIGISKRHKICATEPCDIGQPSFRDVQCGEFNDWVYPEDGKTHKWKGFHMHDENPCVLFCVNDERVVASLKPKVIDGTTCHHGIRDICIGGVCREIPCDLNLESKAIEDSCGVCHGDSTQCLVTEGMEFFMKERGATKLVHLPEGTRNIKIEEMEPTKSKIMVKSCDGKEYFIRGNHLGMFAVPGSKAWLGMIRNEQEALNIPGPLGEPIAIWIVTKQNVTIKYSYALKQEERRSASFHWDFVDWSRCSAQCGTGTEEAVPKCIEAVGGLVEDVYCKEPKPDDKARECTLGPCIPRWMIGDWQPCQNCATKLRSVKCVKPTGNGEGEADVIRDTECQGPKPREKDNCSCEADGNKKQPKRHTRMLDRSIVEDMLDLVADRVKKQDDILNEDISSSHEEPEKRRENPPVKSVPAMSGNKTDHCNLLSLMTTESSARNKTINRGQLVVDNEEPADVRMTMLLERNSNGGIVLPKGLDLEANDSSIVHMQGLNALKLLETIQEQNATNKS